MIRQDPRSLAFERGTRTALVSRLLNKLMGLVALLACCGPAALTLDQADGQEPDARALGIAEAVSSYCAKADPSSAAKVRERIKRLTAGASPETLAKVRNSDEYRRAHDSEDNFLGIVDPKNAKRVCSGTVAAGK
jgi:hypothetical protein